MSGLTPHCAVIVATIRALKCHGGAPIPMPGQPLDPAYSQENVEWVEKGCENLIHHIKTVKKAGINPVVCINHFYTDTDNEVKAVRRLAEEAGAELLFPSTGSMVAKVLLNLPMQLLKPAMNQMNLNSFMNLKLRFVSVLN
jgi:formyltetrahydrofolate synthetase